ncbi:anti-sigma factor [Rhodococcus antarcticus]|uniref:Anti-sigma factor n=1 Tax=Rhodococcus antarcticus TaxID=2987751 RepID=A0ABY6P365_9NOCA|nr:anti-sigma factor [Rhodococcus antarcticus]UZJ26086.1 anti-sigma factor [Rhodococcus antarcticus]
MSEQHRQECAQRELAVGWALHALEPEEEVGFARHLPHCEDCTERVRSTEAVASLLGGGAEQLDPPPRLRTAILAAARAQQPVRVAALQQEPPRARPVELAVPAEPSRSISRTRRVLVAAAAVGLVAFGAGWVGNALTGAGSPATQSALPDLSNAAVHSTPLTGAVSGQVMAVVLNDGTSASVVPLSLSSAPTGEAYWLWGTGGTGGKPVALGRVTVGDGAAADLQLQDAVQPASFSGYALSIESDIGVPSAPSTVIGSSGTV